MTRLIVGCGYLGRRVAAAWQERGDAVWALTRSRRHAAEFSSQGITPVIGDVLDPASLRSLPAADTVLCAVGYDRTAAASKRAVYVDGLRNVLHALPPGVCRLIYVSSTSVYGQSDGGWVDESSPCEPSSEGGRICLAAEAVVRQSLSECEDLLILRLAGLYGPGRLAARVHALKSRRRIEGNPDGWVNLIHVDDAGDVILACADRPTSDKLLLVSDGRPQLRREYYRQLATAIGAPEPVFQRTDELQDLGKRCSNQNLLDSLSLELTYPSILEGLPTAI